MSIETRSSSALFKRAEQLKRWETSETNREPPRPRQIDRKIKFSAECVYLAACAAGDKEDVVRLLQKGADINTGNVDGLTALHQACIGDDLDMVEFLVEQGADINRGDNEGWTPLHATASCGFISIAKYLIEQGCNLGAVNNDGQLALDIAESDEMEDMLQKFINEAGIDCNQARSEEERLMMNDARAWRGGAPGKDTIHPRTGATALHVAAAKGYLRVINTLLQACCDVNAQDFDGWTPLHGAAHWGQLEACKILVENYCDMDIKNYSGQTAFDVADPDIVKELEELRIKQQILLKDHPQLIQKASVPSKKRVSTNNENVVAAPEDSDIFEEETPNKVKKVELEIQSDKEDSSSTTNSDVEKKNRANRDETASRLPSTPAETNQVPNQAPIMPPKQQTENNEDGSIPSWRRSGSFRSRNTEIESTNSISTRIEDKEKSSSKSPSSPNKIAPESEVVLRRTRSFEADEKRRDVKLNLELTRDLGTRVQTGSMTSPTSPPSKATTPVSNATLATTVTPTTSPVPANQIRSKQQADRTPSSLSSNTTTATPVTPTTPGGSKLSPGNIFKNFFKSFVPPVRDEESETQRKAHAKRVRETRRSTQGVTLDEIKSAEQLVKKKQQLNNESSSPVTAPSSQFQLEDANNRTTTDTTTAYIRRPSGGTGVPRPSSAPVETITASSADTTITLPLRRPLKPPEDKEQDKENDSRNAQATQAVIQRRRRPKRRSTGVVHVDMDEIDPDRQDTSASGDYDDSKVNHNESGNERSGRSSRLGSVSSVTSDTQNPPTRTKLSASENGELDYKKLYEESQVENERLKEKLRQSDEQLKEAQSLLDKAQNVQTKNSLSEAEKRERRAMERKLSEMEEELKQLQKLKAENERLKAENRALTRVVSKLTNTTK